MRNEGGKDVRWDLSDLFFGLDDPAIEEVLVKTQKQASVFNQKYKDKVDKLIPEELFEGFKEEENIITPLYKVSQYSHLVYSIDTQDHMAKSLVVRVEDVVSKVTNSLLFFNLELGLIAKEKMEAFLSSSKLEKYQYRLKQIQNKAKYKLSEKEEQIINLKDLTGIEAMRKLYTELTASFEFNFEMDGKVKKMNGSELRALRYHPDKDVRRRAMKLFFAKYKDNKLVITNTFNNIIKDFNVEAKQRGYEGPISVMNVANDLDDKAVQVLHEVTTRSYPLVHRYYKLKKKMLGLEKMTLADIYAPLPEYAKKYSWDEARTIVLDSYQSFDQEFYDLAKMMFDEKRVDAPVLPTKRGGAYCSSSTPDLKPYVLLNFLGRERDISTISHELGHALHAMYSKNLPLWSYHAILPLCETASVFSEMLLMDYLRKTGIGKNELIALISAKLEELFATSHRQNMFSRFEMVVHNKIIKGPMNSEELCELYQEELKLMFGDSIEYTDEYKWEWATIPHMLDMPFYVYSYNFGNLLVIALYKKYQEEGSEFIPKFKKILSMGSSAAPQEIISLAGADINSGEIWQKSLEFIKGMVEELKDLVG